MIAALRAVNPRSQGAATMGHAARLARAPRDARAGPHGRKRRPMQLPFTSAQFLDVFRAYNLAVWPAQLVLVALALAALAAAARGGRRASVAASAILAALWAWLAIAYHLAFFARINPLAPAFAAASLAAAGIFAWLGVVRRRLAFAWPGGARGWAGALLAAFALAGYPVASRLAGHAFPATPTFGLPCPTTLFTVGMLAFLVAPYPRVPFVVPVAWCLVGAQAAVALAMPQDASLLAAAAVGIALAIRNRAASRAAARGALTAAAPPSPAPAAPPSRTRRASAAACDRGARSPPGCAGSARSRPRS